MNCMVMWNGVQHDDVVFINMLILYGCSPLPTCSHDLLCPCMCVVQTVVLDIQSMGYHYHYHAITMMSLPTSIHYLSGISHFHFTAFFPHSIFISQHFFLTAFSFHSIANIPLSFPNAHCYVTLHYGTPFITLVRDLVLHRPQHPMQVLRNARGYWPTGVVGVCVCACVCMWVYVGVCGCMWVYVGTHIFPCIVSPMEHVHVSTIYTDTQFDMIPVPSIPATHNTHCT